MSSWLVIATDPPSPWLIGAYGPFTDRKLADEAAERHTGKGVDCIVVPLLAPAMLGQW